jgi:hypothetical protein
VEISFFATTDASVPTVIRSVSVELSEEEAAELADALREMVRAPERGANSDHHLVDTAGNQVTLWLKADDGVPRLGLDV